MIVTSVYNWTSVVSSPTVTQLPDGGAVLTSEKIDRTATVITGLGSASFDPMRTKRESSGVYENPKTATQQKTYSSSNECNGPQYLGGVIWRQETMARNGSLSAYGRTSTSSTSTSSSASSTNAIQNNSSSSSSSSSTFCLPCSTR